MSLCDEIQKLGKGVGNGSRYAILEALMGGPKTVTEIVRQVKQSQPAVSQHLKTLKACELVVDEKRGQEVLYSINMKHMLALLKEFATKLRKPGASH